MAIGGFNGTDPSPTLAQFQQYVAEGKIHYFIGGGGFGGGGPTGGSASAQEIASLGRATLHRHDRRRRHRLRPDRLSPPNAGRSTVDRPASALPRLVPALCSKALRDIPVLGAAGAYRRQPDCSCRHPSQDVSTLTR